MILRARITTFSGSVYEVRRDVARDTWWMRGDNVPSIASVPLAKDEWWEIQWPSPWPPQFNESMLLRALESLAMDSPLRMPGGGKFTSPVVGIVILEEE